MGKTERRRENEKVEGWHITGGALIFASLKDTPSSLCSVFRGHSVMCTERICDVHTV